MKSFPLHGSRYYSSTSKTLQKCFVNMMYWNKQGTALVQQSTAAELSNLLQNPLTSGFFIHMQFTASISPGLFNN